MFAVLERDLWIFPAYCILQYFPTINTCKHHYNLGIHAFSRYSDFEWCHLHSFVLSVTSHVMGYVPLQFEIIHMLLRNFPILDGQLLLHYRIKNVSSIDYELNNYVICIKRKGKIIFNALLKRVGNKWIIENFVNRLQWKLQMLLALKLKNIVFIFILCPYWIFLYCLRMSLLFFSTINNESWNF